jgi:uncharacterized lipoprotein YajG
MKANSLSALSALPSFPCALISFRLGRRLGGTILLLLGLLLWSGCDNPERTVQTLEKQISAYTEQPTAPAEAEIEASFSRLDAEISRLQARGQTAEANQLSQQRVNLRARYEAARLAGGLLKARQALENVGETVRQVGQQIGDSIREATQPAPTLNE